MTALAHAVAISTILERDTAFDRLATPHLPQRFQDPKVGFKRRRVKIGLAIHLRRLCVAPVLSPTLALYALFACCRNGLPLWRQQTAETAYRDRKIPERTVTETVRASDNLQGKNFPALSRLDADWVVGRRRCSEAHVADEAHCTRHARYVSVFL